MKKKSLLESYPLVIKETRPSKVEAAARSLRHAPEEVKNVGPAKTGLMDKIDPRKERGLRK
jgi:hypothetical protein